MRLESAMYSSKEGLVSHGSAISVIGDNVSNSNTVAYKTGRVEFSDIFAEGSDGRSSTAVESSGNGSKVATVRQIHEAGTIEATGRGLDVAIDGQGFFMLGSAADPSLSRAGNFQLDGDGFLVNSSGLPVLGFLGAGTTLEPINVNNVPLAATPTSTATILGNLSATSPVTTAPANPETFTEIGQTASSTSNITVYDSLGQSHTVTLAYTHTGQNTWTVQAFIDGADVGGTAGQPTQLGTDVTLTFQADGTMAEADRAGAVLTAAPAYSNGAAAGNFSVDFSGFSQFASLFQISSNSQDGQSVGSVVGYEFGSSGEFYAVLDSLERIQVATLQLATVTSVDGLERAGNTLYKTSTQSGDAEAGTPGAGGIGSLVGGSLERSTVDLANEFVNMTVYQRGYQANSQAFTVATRLIEQTLGLIR